MTFSRLLTALLLSVAAMPCVAADQAMATPLSAAVEQPTAEAGWVSLFNGENLEGWKASENEGTFSVEDGLLVANGKRSHLFYVGDVNDASFKDFELWVEVKTEPKANSGIYFHTAWQDEGWPKKGYEAQVNQTHGDPRKTGSLYGVVDVMNDSSVEDGEWFSQHITVRGKRIVVRVNGKVTADYAEPQNAERKGRLAGRWLSEGTFALQGHDPGSLVRYRQVWVKPLD